MIEPSLQRFACNKMSPIVFDPELSSVACRCASLRKVVRIIALRFVAYCHRLRREFHSAPNSKAVARIVMRLTNFCSKRARDLTLPNLCSDKIDGDVIDDDFYKKAKAISLSAMLTVFRGRRRMLMYKKVFTNLLFVWRKEMRALEASGVSIRPQNNAKKKNKRKKKDSQKRLGFGEGALATRWNKKAGEHFCSKDEMNVKAHRVARKRPPVFVFWLNAF